MDAQEIDPAKKSPMIKIILVVYWQSTILESRIQSCLPNS